MGKYFSDDIITSTNLDLFHDSWHKQVHVPENIQKLSLDLEQYYTYWDYSFAAPRKQWHLDHESVFRGLRSIELNPTELCNRTCHFCPRFDPLIYPNQNFNMEMETCESLLVDLRKHKYQGIINFSGMGEPLLNKNILSMIKMFSSYNIFTNLNTNGDKIVNDQWYTIDDFISAGLSLIRIDVYDNADQYFYWRNKLDQYKGKIRFEIRPQFLTVSKSFHNRTGMSTHKGISSRVLDKKCYTPSTLGFIDWNGDVLLCCNDWSRSGGTFGNVNNVPFHKIWNNMQMNEIRGSLMNNSRKQVGSPCNKCSANGNQKCNSVKTVWEKVLT